MIFRRTLPLVLLTALMPFSAQAKLVHQAVAYEHGGVKLEGWLVYDDKRAAREKLPGVLVLPEWWGLNDHIRRQADGLAKHGYRVLAVDLFGSVATTPDEARAQVADLDQAQALANLKAAETALRERGATKIASLGWCFGGGQSLQLATASGEQLDATVVYYGNLPIEDAQLRTIAWPVLGIFGDQDQSIPTTSVARFKKSLDRLGIDNEIHMYPGVGHAFANPSNAGFAPQETADAWEKTLAFLEQNLK